MTIFLSRACFCLPWNSSLVSAKRHGLQPWVSMTSCGVHQKDARAFADPTAKRFKEAENNLVAQRAQLAGLRAAMAKGAKDVQRKKLESSRASRAGAKLATHAANVASWRHRQPEAMPQLRCRFECQRQSLMGMCGPRKRCSIPIVSSCVVAFWPPNRLPRRRQTRWQQRRTQGEMSALHKLNDEEQSALQELGKI